MIKNQNNASDEVKSVLPYLTVAECTATSKQTKHNTQVNGTLKWAAILFICVTNVVILSAW